MIDGIKKLFDIAFQHETRIRAVFHSLPRYLFQDVNSLVDAESDAARKRRRDECLFEDWVDNRENCVMQYAVANSSLMDVPLFRILNIKAGIGAMLVGSVFKIAVKIEDMLFKVAFKRQHVPLVSLAALESVPRRKKIFRGNNLVE